MQFFYNRVPYNNITLCNFCKELDKLLEIEKELQHYIEDRRELKHDIPFYINKYNDLLSRLDKNKLHITKRIEIRNKIQTELSDIPKNYGV